MKLIQFVAIGFVVVLILNMVLFATKKISLTVFWAILAVSFAVAYAINYANKKEKGKKK